MTPEQQLRATVLEHLYHTRPVALRSEVIAVHLTRAGLDCSRSDVERELDALFQAGLVTELTAPGINVRRYKVTAAGIAAVENPPR